MSALVVNVKGKGGVGKRVFGRRPNTTNTREVAASGSPMSISRSPSPFTSPVGATVCCWPFARNAPIEVWSACLKTGHSSFGRPFTNQTL